MLARLLRGATLWMAFWAAIFGYFWIVQAVAGAAPAFFAIVFFNWWIIGLQCLRLRRVNGRDTAPRPTVGDVARAWVREAWTAWRVFYWRQPWRSHVWPDTAEPGARPATGVRGIVFIHGFICNRGLWHDWMQRARAEGRPYVGVNLEPVFGSIDAYAPLIEAAVQRATAATGVPPLLVCHSMGGLAARAWLRAQRQAGADGLARVHRVVTLGTPHHGTRVGDGVPPVAAVRNGEQMRWGSAWVRELAAQEPASQASRFTCFYSNCDNIVLPASTAALPGADNRFVPGCPHVALVFEPAVIGATWALLA